LRAEPITSALFGKARASILALLYEHSERSFYYREITRELIHLSPGTIQRELSNLERLGLIVRSGSGKQVFYRANMQAPAAPELKSFLQKSTGLSVKLKEKLGTFGRRIRVAFIYGSVAEGRERAESDVDLMIIGSAPFESVVDLVAPLERSFRKRINPTVYSRDDFRRKLGEHNHFLKTVLKREKLFLIGDESELERLGEERLASR
jgi:predicted nucleotidyltransferase